MAQALVAPRPPSPAPRADRAYDPRVLGIDPGFAATGWVIARDGFADMNPLPVAEAAGVIRTEPDKRNRLYVTVDDVRRWERVLFDLCAVAEQHGVVAICAEMPGGSKSSRAATALAYARTAVAAARARLGGIPIAWATPAQVKQAGGGKPNASKADVIDGTFRLWPALADWVPNRQDREHVADAAGAILATWDSEVIRAARRGGRKWVL